MKNSKTQPPTEQQFNWKKSMRKHTKQWGKNKGELIVTNFSTHLTVGDDGDRPLFPRLTEGGQLRQPIE